MLHRQDDTGLAIDDCAVAIENDEFHARRSSTPPERGKFGKGLDCARRLRAAEAAAVQIFAAFSLIG